MKWPSASSKSTILLATLQIYMYVHSLSIYQLYLTSRTGMRCRELFVTNCDIFSVSSIFKRNPGKTNDKFITC